LGLRVCFDPGGFVQGQQEAGAEMLLAAAAEAEVKVERWLNYGEE
jgi:hypothetical protein